MWMLKVDMNTLGGVVRSWIAGVCYSALVGWQNLAEESLSLDTHLAKATERWCYQSCTATKGIHHSDNQPAIGKNKVTRNNLLAFICQMYFVWCSLKIPHPVSVKLEKPFCVCQYVSPREPSGESITGLESAHSCAPKLREAVEHVLQPLACFIFVFTNFAF